MPAAAQPTHCPDCRRPVFPRRQSRTGRANDVIKGKVQAVLSDGTCNTCYVKRRGWSRPTRAKSKQAQPEIQMLPPRFTPEQISDYEVERCRERFEAYVSNRRRRGIPEDGMPVERLDNGGAFHMDVS